MQTKGRGRDRNKWESPRGGLWFSVIVRPKIPSAKAYLLQFLAATATLRALESKTGFHALLKWPNDLVAPQGKLGGILVESKTEGEKLRFAVIGIGINVNLRRTQLPSGASSILLATRTRHDLQDLLKGVIVEMRSRFRLLENPSLIMKEWWQLCIHRPQSVRVVTHDATLTGITRGVGEDGSLLLETEDHEVHNVREGTLRLHDHSID